MNSTKSFTISKQTVFDAYKRVKANKGSAGVDEETIKDFERNLKSNLYKIWNRMSSGSYFPPAIRRVEIAKDNGKKKRKLGIPTVSDRIAQMVGKMYLEPILEPIFHDDSYGYRPGKSAIDAVGKARERCWRYDWVLDVDIKGFFDNIDHELMMKAVQKHTDCKWILLYIERWLKAPVQLEDGTLEARDKGTPQGGVISPAELEDVVKMLNPVLRGWINYFNKYYKSAILPALNGIDNVLIKWARKKYKKLNRNRSRAKRWLSSIKFIPVETGKNPKGIVILFC